MRVNSNTAKAKVPWYSAVPIPAWGRSVQGGPIPWWDLIVPCLARQAAGEIQGGWYGAIFQQSNVSVRRLGPYFFPPSPLTCGTLGVPVDTVEVKICEEHSKSYLRYTVLYTTVIEKSFNEDEEHKGKILKDMPWPKLKESQSWEGTLYKPSSVFTSQCKSR